MSTVILSGLPFNCQESDIHRALLMYGTAIDIQLNRQHQQAFVTMRTQMEAQALLNRKTVNVLGNSARVDPAPQLAPSPMDATVNVGGRQTNPPMPMGTTTQMYGGMPYNQQPQQQPLQLPQQYSIPEPSPQQQYPIHQPQQQPQYQMSPPPHQQQPMYQPSQPPPPQQQQSYAPYSNSMNTVSNNNNNYGQSVYPTQPQQTPVYGAGAGGFRSPRLHVVVEDCKFPITREVLVEMFNMVDKPVNVYCGPSGPTTTGDVEFVSAESAERAMMQFNNKNIYPGCCMLRLSYAQQRSSSGQGDGNRGAYASHGDAGQQTVLPAPAPYGDRGGGYGGYGGGGGAGGGDGYSGGGGGGTYPQQDMAMTMMGRGMGRGSRGAIRGGVRGGYNQGGFDPFRAPPQLPSRMPFEGRRPLPFYGHQQEEGTVVVSNVAETVALYDLWVLLEVFGNVNSLKRQYKEKTNVTAQFQHAQDAKTAVFFLQGCPFRGKPLGLKLFAGYVERGGRVEWNVGPATDPATQAFLFTSGYHHRTKPSAPFNPLGRVRPDKNIFVSNLVEAISDNEVKVEFEQVGLVVESYYRKDPTAAIVGFKDTETAIDALIAVHAKQIKDRYLRITFSRFPPGPRDESTREAEHDEDFSKAINDITAETHTGEAGDEEETEPSGVAPRPTADAVATTDTSSVGASEQVKAVDAAKRDATKKKLNAG